MFPALPWAGGGWGRWLWPQPFFVNVYIRVSMAIAATATLMDAITVAVTATVGSCSGNCRLQQCDYDECDILPN